MHKASASELCKGEVFFTHSALSWVFCFGFFVVAVAVVVGVVVCFWFFKTSFPVANEASPGTHSRTRLASMGFLFFITKMVLTLYCRLLFLSSIATPCV